MPHIVYIPPLELGEVWAILRSPKRAYCLPSRRRLLRTWLRERRPRLPAWGIDIYGYDPEAETSDTEYEYLFSLYQLNWLQTKLAEKLMSRTDRPYVLRKYYWWD